MDNLDIFYRQVGSPDKPAILLLHGFPTSSFMFREEQPPTLIVWGENDQFFTKEGALEYGKDLQKIEYNFYPSGHFALEEFYVEIDRSVYV